MEDQASCAGLRVPPAGFRANYSGIREGLGSNAALAAILSVSARQLSRWARGVEPVDQQADRIIAELDLIVGQARMLWTRKATAEWFQGSNTYLNGARPIDALIAHRFSEVADALESAQSG